MIFLSNKNIVEGNKAAITDKEFQLNLRRAYDEIKDKSKQHVNAIDLIHILVAITIFSLLCPRWRRIFSSIGSNRCVNQMIYCFML